MQFTLRERKEGVQSEHIDVFVNKFKNMPAEIFFFSLLNWNAR